MPLEVGSSVTRTIDGTNDTFIIDVLDPPSTVILNLTHKIDATFDDLAIILQNTLNNNEILDTGWAVKYIKAQQMFLITKNGTIASNYNGAGGTASSLYGNITTSLLRRAITDIVYEREFDIDNISWTFNF